MVKLEGCFLKSTQEANLSLSLSLSLIYTHSLNLGERSGIMVVQPVSPALGRIRPEDLKFKARLGYMVGPCLKKNQKYTNNK
jgi:hypothetical protein